VKDRDTLFHEKWLGLAQPVEGLVFSIPVLADAQIAPEIRPELSASFAAHLDASKTAVASAPAFLREFLGYAEEDLLVDREQLPEALSFYAAEGGQELRPSYAIARAAERRDDLFADAGSSQANFHERGWSALVWDLTETSEALDLDASETLTGSWRYPPTSKFERLLRHVGVPVGLLFNGQALRLVYAPAGESTAHLTFRVEHMVRPEGRPLLAALELLLHARRALTASPEHTLEGLLAESRRRQADVTEKLAKQVFEAVEVLVAGFEAASARDGSTGEDWLRAALEEEGDHFYQGVLSVVLRVVFLLYAEDQSLLPVEHPVYAKHLSLAGLYARLSDDAGAHPESMHHRFGAYGQLLSLFRALFYGVQHGTLALPPRRGRLFDPNAFPFLEGGLPGWTAALIDPAARAAANPPSVDDETVYKVLHRLMVFEAQRLSYRTLDVEQIGSVYESLMGFHVLRVTSPAVRLGKLGVWVESASVRALKQTERTKLWKDTCVLSKTSSEALELALRDAKDDMAVAECLANCAQGRKADLAKHRVSAGSLVLQPGEERRRTASHYTPRSLTEKVVKRTLEPLLACLGPEPTADQLLQLKICDPAMGSGAFLVAACRELASEIVAAWTRAGALAGIVEKYGDAHLHARRLVAQQCLYGVDKNAAAVELAKLALWLVTLSRTLPFTFVDHALRHGDSLVGLDFHQIESFHWAPTKQTETYRGVLREAIVEATELRQQILALANDEHPVAQREKRRLLEFAEQATERVRTIADVCVGVFFAEKKDAAREKERARRLALVTRWLEGDDAASAEVGVLADEARDRLMPFHWWIEFPEVFVEARPDPLYRGESRGAASMDGVIGNPPFGGKNTIAERNVDGYVDWLKVITPRAHGNADLSAHFFRRAERLIGEHGTFGLIATYTIAQGDSRDTGLKALVAGGWVFFDAVKSMKWPGTAKVTVSVVHAAHGAAREKAEVRRDGVPVPEINSRLRPKPERHDPVSLKDNIEFGFIGAYPLGTGFELTPVKREALVARDERNNERIYPYLGGEEVNTSPTQTFKRYVIDFGQMSLKEAERWPDLIGIVRETVKPERDQLKDNADGRRRKQYWWQFGRWTPALYEALAPLSRCIVIPQQFTTFVRVAFQPVNRVLSQKLIVLALERYSAFGVLQSSAHNAWTMEHCGRMGAANSPVYTPSDCFETFPFPQRDPRKEIKALEEAGKVLYCARASYMEAQDFGLTDLYNRLKDPSATGQEITKLRGLHEELDRAVLEAYGWTDIPVPSFCPRTAAERAALEAFEDDVIDRLYVLNAERAPAERGRAATPKKRGKSNTADEQRQLPGLEIKPTKRKRAKSA
jgi:DnaJ-domain-containing protein 1